MVDLFTVMLVFLFLGGVYNFEVDPIILLGGHDHSDTGSDFLWGHSKVLQYFGQKWQSDTV